MPRKKTPPLKLVFLEIPKELIVKKDEELIPKTLKKKRYRFLRKAIMISNINNDTPQNRLIEDEENQNIQPVLSKNKTSKNFIDNLSTNAFESIVWPEVRSDEYEDQWNESIDCDFNEFFEVQ